MATYRGGSRSASPHIGRSWTGHALEDACPCPQQSCGLVAVEDVVPGCPEHQIAAAKSIRQSHEPQHCPGATS